VAGSTLRPPISYFGSKQRIAAAIARLLPDHLHYVEPYCGSLSVLLAKRPSLMETVNADHRALAEALRECSAAVLLSGYASDLYDRELYRGWDRLEIPALTGNSPEPARTEVVWSNRQLSRQTSLFEVEDHDEDPV
jgi:site-specific DNA-adenine methylase